MRTTLLLPCACAALAALCAPGSAFLAAPALRGAIGRAPLQPAAAARRVASRTIATRVVCQAEPSDKITGAKFEEKDAAKNPQGRPGHAVGDAAEVEVSPETARKREIIRLHQEKCAKPTWAEEIRTIMSQKEGFATLATFSKKHDGFPFASVVGFAVDDAGKPFFCFSGMSVHTQNLLANPKVSLSVTEKGFKGAADARVTVVGEVEIVPAEEDAALRALYRESHPGAYWADFGDFKMYRFKSLIDVSFVGGFARAGGVTVEEYAAAEADPLAAFAAPVMKHMNADHTDSLKEYVQFLVGVEGDIDIAEMKRLDKYGFDVRVSKGNDSGVLRIPFPSVVTERAAVKEAIVALSKEVAAIKEKKAAEANA